MHWIDWSILFAFAVFITLIAYRTKKYAKSVADFLAASRCGGRYILAMADGMAGFGAISIVAMFQAYYEAGFTVFWWQAALLPVALLVAMIGWVIYRFRQTRALTLAQFFGVRYSKGFRVFAGFMAFLSGIINFGIFPSVGSRFFIYVCGLPQTLPILGMDVSTYGLVMAVLVLLSVSFTFLGGQIAVMVTDFIQAAFCNVAFLVVLAVLYVKFNWAEIASTLSDTPAGESMINPFRIGNLENYNTFYWLIAMFGMFFNSYAWQGTQAYNCSAKNAHEAKMSKVMGFYRWLTPMLFVMMLPVCAYTLMHHVNFTQEAQVVNETLSTISSEQIRSQMTVPLALRQILPVGVLGAFCAVMFAAFVSTHDTYLHSWGSIFIQDVVLPFRKKPLTPKQHIRYLRLAIVGVAIFIFFFSYYYSQKSDILMFFALSGTIFLGGSGAAIIGGLYWKRGTAGGAWAAMITGSTMAVLGFVVDQGWPEIANYIQQTWPGIWSAASETFPSLNARKFLFTAQEMFFFAMVASSVNYILVSLLGKRAMFNLDRMLHRGRYAIKKDKNSTDEVVGKIGWKNVIGFDKHFTRGDKLTYVVSYVAMFLFLGGFIAMALWNWLFGIEDTSWLIFWRGFIVVMGVLMVALILWLTIGGFYDLRELFVLLRAVKRDDRDDGTVIGHHHLDEETGEAETAVSDSDSDSDS